MRKSIILLAAITAIVIFSPSCKQTEESGDLKFGLELSEDSALKSASGDYLVSAALVTIMSETGEILYDKEELPIYKFGNQYTTKSLKLPMGGFQLQEFMLIDTMGVVLWATPMAGSPLAHLVRNPLPLPFVISADETTNLDIQVIRIKDHPPVDFGYANFDIGFVDRFCLKVFYSSRCIEEWPDGLMAPIHQSMITIRARDQVVLQEPLVAGLNHFNLPIVAEWYGISASDCTGQVIYEDKLPLDQLLENLCGNSYEPLLISRDSLPNIFITPEGLSEPSIRQGVFGSVVLPVDDTLYLDNFMLFPMIQDIYFYPYAVLDSIYTFAPMDCYFPAELISVAPTAIVRSNSEGIFQVALQEGHYLYLVKDGDRYYMDSFISSHLPGFVEVFPQKVSELIINMIDCSMWM